MIMLTLGWDFIFKLILHLCTYWLIWPVQELPIVWPTIRHHEISIWSVCYRERRPRNSSIRTLWPINVACQLSVMEFRETFGRTLACLEPLWSYSEVLARQERVWVGFVCKFILLSFPRFWVYEIKKRGPFFLSMN